MGARRRPASRPSRRRCFFASSRVDPAMRRDLVLGRAGLADPGDGVLRVVPAAGPSSPSRRRFDGVGARFPRRLLRRRSSSSESPDPDSLPSVPPSPSPALRRRRPPRRRRRRRTAVAALGESSPSAVCSSVRSSPAALAGLRGRLLGAGPSSREPSWRRPSWPGCRLLSAGLVATRSALAGALKSTLVPVGNLVGRLVGRSCSRPALSAASSSRAAFFAAAFFARWPSSQPSSWPRPSSRAPSCAAFFAGASAAEILDGRFRADSGWAGVEVSSAIAAPRPGPPMAPGLV